ncbi:hypothetical protein Hanom_Chr09g00813451 [Helianthus anomalus]
MLRNMLRFYRMSKMPLLLKSELKIKCLIYIMEKKSLKRNVNTSPFNTRVDYCWSSIRHLTLTLEVVLKTD